MLGDVGIICIWIKPSARYTSMSKFCTNSTATTAIIVRIRFPVVPVMETPKLPPPISIAAAPSTFVKPGDRVNLSLLNDIHTSAVDLKGGKWGVALLNIQANLPKALNSKGVVMVALGDVRAQSAVLPNAALKLPDAPVLVLVGAKGADLFNIPSRF